MTWRGAADVAPLLVALALARGGATRLRLQLVSLRSSAADATDAAAADAAEKKKEKNKRKKKKQKAGKKDNGKAEVDEDTSDGTDEESAPGAEDEPAPPPKKKRRFTDQHVQPTGQAKSIMRAVCNSVAVHNAVSEVKADDDDCGSTTGGTTGAVAAVAYVRSTAQRAADKASQDAWACWGLQQGKSKKNAAADARKQKRSKVVVNLDEEEAPGAGAIARDRAARTHTIGRKASHACHDKSGGNKDLTRVRAHARA